MSRSLRIGFVALTVVALIATTASVALGHGDGRGGGRKVFDARLVGEPVSQVGLTLFGVQAGGLPWNLKKGFAQIYSNGRIHVSVRGLVLASGSAAGTNPVAHGQAIVVCDGAVAATSTVVPFSATGNATVNERISLPAQCLAPVVFFAGVPTPGVQRWFAVTGW